MVRAEKVVLVGKVERIQATPSRSPKSQYNLMPQMMMQGGHGTGVLSDELDQKPIGMYGALTPVILHATF